MAYARNRADRQKAAALVVALHVALGAALISGLGVDTVRQATETLKSYTVEEVPPPPPPPPTLEQAGARQEPAPANMHSRPLPQVAPPPRIPLPAPPAADVRAPETGLDRTAGAADEAGPGTGAGGSGNGFGGGGTGGSGAGPGGEVGSPARLIRGMRSRLDETYLRGFAVSSGRAVLALTIDARGRVQDCEVTEGTGSPMLDQELCARMASRSRWQPALDRNGEPIPVRVRYTATWSRG
ncbi:energy transducer TonB [Sphingomonas arenae]|uniref:energy transducer TonB n=1 Tax=Sphingomonas arenae TaxID=2812555 RepID=UPI0019681CCF|nr:TonB family protein [Sphingomonas arenae]